MLQFFLESLKIKIKKNSILALWQKKKIGNSVKRNKIKRRLRKITNDAVKEISIKFSYSYLVIAKPSMLNKDYTNIKETLFQDFKNIR